MEWFGRSRTRSWPTNSRAHTRLNPITARLGSYLAQGARIWPDLVARRSQLGGGGTRNVWRVASMVRQTFKLVRVRQEKGSSSLGCKISFGGRRPTHVSAR